MRVQFSTPVCLKLASAFLAVTCKFITVSLLIKPSIIDSRFWLSCYDFRCVLGLISLHILRLAFCTMKFETKYKVNNKSSVSVSSFRKNLNPFWSIMKEYPPTSVFCLLVKSCPANHFLRHFTASEYFYIIWWELSPPPHPPHTPWQLPQLLRHKELNPPQDLAVSAGNSDCPNSWLGTT